MKKKKKRVLTAFEFRRRGRNIIGEIKRKKRERERKKKRERE